VARPSPATGTRMSAKLVNVEPLDPGPVAYPDRDPLCVFQRDQSADTITEFRRGDSAAEAASDPSPTWLVERDHGASDVAALCADHLAPAHLGCQPEAADVAVQVRQCRHLVSRTASSVAEGRVSDSYLA
jgi:hypothetical protein